MTYKVSAHKGEGVYVCIAAFNVMAEAIAYASEKTFETGEYHLVEVSDGGRH